MNKYYGCLVITTLQLSTFVLQAQHTVNNPLPEWAFGGFTRPTTGNPVISPQATLFSDPMSNKQVSWEGNFTFNPAATIHNGKIVVLYRAEDKTGTVIGTRTSRIGYASSDDGLHFRRKPSPVLFPANDDQKKYEWPGGCEDPRVAVTEDGTYVLFYTQWNRDVPRLGVATSTDLVKWVKHGPIFLKAFGAKYCNVPHKSASIVTKLVNGKQVIAKINGKYWMYWGELHVFAATSDNLIDWTPLLSHDQLAELMSPRPGFFDSELTECGPPAIVTDKGILLIYNGKNKAGADADPNSAQNTYAAGQALFSKTDPSRFIARLDKPFFRPMEPFEKSGQYEAGTVFAEGLVYFKKKWWLYYGCADSFVGVAVFDPANPAPADPLR